MMVEHPLFGYTMTLTEERRRYEEYISNYKFFVHSNTELKKSSMVNINRNSSLKWWIGEEDYKPTHASKLPFLKMMNTRGQK